METSAVTKVVTLVTLTDGKGGNGVEWSDKSVEEHWKLCRLCKSFKIRVREVHLRRLEHNIRNVTFERKLKKRHCRDEYRKVYWFMKR